MTISGIICSRDNFRENQNFSRKYWFSKYFTQTLTKMFRFRTHFRENLEILGTVRIRCPNIVAPSRLCCHVLAILYSSLSCQADLSRLTCPDYLIQVVLSQVSCPACSVLTVLSWLSCYSFLSRLPYASWPVLATMFWLVCPLFPALAVLFRLSSLAVLSLLLFHLSCTGCPVQADLSRLICQADLSRLTFLGCPVPVLIS